MFALSYYLEVVASRNAGALSFALNLKMLDTILTDEISSNVLNEIQDININSTISLESYVR